MNINNSIVSRPIQFTISFGSKYAKGSKFKACLGLSDEENKNEKVKNGICKILGIYIERVSEKLKASFTLNLGENSPFSLKEYSHVWHKICTVQPQGVALCLLFPIRKQLCEEDRLEVVISTLADEVLIKLSYDLIRASHQLASKDQPTVSIKLPNKSRCLVRNPYFLNTTNNFLLANLFFKNFFINKPVDRSDSPEPMPSNVATILTELNSSSTTDENEHQQPTVITEPNTEAHPRPTDSSDNFITPPLISCPGYGRPVFIHTYSTNSPGPERTVLMAPRAGREPYTVPSRMILPKHQTNHNGS